MTAQQLKNSILQMAVQGKLVPQDPNDEPASVLLERIRAEKEQLIKQKKIKKEKNPSYIFRGADNTPYEKIGNNEPVSIADEVPFEIPDSWEWVRLGTISTYAETKQKINAQSADCSIWGLDLEDIEKGGRLITHKTVGERKAVGDKTVFYKGDILYSKLRPYLLKILVAPDDGICTPEIVPFRMYGEINPEYIVHFLKSPYVNTLINTVTYGVKMPRVGTETMVSLFVPIPPVQEQHRIVAKMNELEPYIEQYATVYSENETLTATFPAELKKSILQMAVQGKLVPQDPVDEPASVLLERIRAEKQRLVAEGKIKRDKHESVIFRRDNSHYEKLDGTERCIDDEIPFELPDTWAWARIKTISTVIVDCPHSTPKYYSEDTGFYSIDTTCINSDGTIQGFRYVDEQAYMSRIARLSPRTGDIVYTREGSIGRAAVLPDVNQVCLGQRVMLLRLSALVDTALYQQVLMSPVVLDPITGKTRGIGAKHINVSDVCNALVPVPPMEEQRRILAALSTVIPILKTI